MMDTTRQEIRAYLARECINETELERRAGVSRSLLGRFMKGRRNLSEQTFVLLAPVVGFSEQSWSESREAALVRRRTLLENTRAGLQSVLLNGPSPCDGCWRQAQCKRNRLACAAFERYVQHGGRWEGVERIPSRAGYQVAMTL